MFKKILVPLDGSELAENTVLPYAESVAEAFGSEVILTNVTRPDDADVSHLYANYLDGVARKIEARQEATGKKFKIGWEILKGSPADEVLEAAKKDVVDLIVLSSVGRSGLGHWDLGGVAIKLLRASTVPVLLIKAKEKVEATRPFGKILVTLDGSTEAEVVLPHLRSLASRMGSKLILFRAVDLASYVPADFAALNQNIAQEIESAAVQYVHQVCDQLKSEGMTQECAAVTSVGPAANQIVDYAEQNNIDLIAMATHGRSGVSRWVFGSVAEKVLEAAQCPILLVRVLK